jgi:histidine triad (HIT) family protein
MGDCIFCKIINNEIPSHKIYEDDLVLAFLDSNPVSSGHTLILPKKHAENIFDIEEKYLERIALVAKKVAQKMKEALGTDGVNLYHASGVHAEQTVFHFHLHVIPRKQDDDICFTRAISKKTISDEDFKVIANKLKIGE